MAETNKQSPLEIQGKINRDQLLPKNKYNEKKTEPLDEASANKDPNGIGAEGSKTDIATRQQNLKFNKYNEKNKYPNF
jgi:hypothetical protein